MATEPLKWLRKPHLKCLEGRQWSGRSVGELELQASARSYLAARGVRHSIVENLTATGAITRVVREVHMSFLRERAVVYLNYLAQCLQSGADPAKCAAVGPGAAAEVAARYILGEKTVDRLVAAATKSAARDTLLATIVKAAGVVGVAGVAVGSLALMGLPPLLVSLAAIGGLSVAGVFLLNHNHVLDD